MERHRPLPLQGILLAACLLAVLARALAADPPAINWVGGVGNSLSQPASFYSSQEARRIAETVLLYQRDNGGWPKNYDRARGLSEADRKKLLGQKEQNDTIFDNGATHSEVRYLAKVYGATGEQRYRQAFLRGLVFILKAQYENGGWPQSYPSARGYSRHITFNDGAMIGVMTALRDIAQDEAAYPSVGEKQRAYCARAVAKGIQCILKCQIEVAGRKTAWCAQHDEKTLAPRKARSYELASISGAESVGIVRFLMQIEKPSDEVVRAIEDAVAWFERSKLTGIKVVRVRDAAKPKGYDRVVVEDPRAPPLWARFYDIKTNQPIFCSRDGIPRQKLADISYERRNGYSWLGSYAKGLLEQDLPAWKRRLGRN
jgi:PelA/Pel-15E family pectate lyase